MPLQFVIHFPSAQQFRADNNNNDVMCLRMFVGAQVNNHRMEKFLICESASVWFVGQKKSDKLFVILINSMRLSLIHI